MPATIFKPIVEELVGAGLRRETAERFIAGLNRRGYAAKELFFSQGDERPRMAFVLSGYVRLYTTDQEGELSVRLIAGPGDIIACVVSAMYASPAFYSAECITDCQLMLIDPLLQSEIRKEVRFRLLMQEIIIRRLLEMMQEKAAMLPLKATDRYLYFMERYPAFLKHVPAATIANYIGVRPQSLSRIRQTLREGKKIPTF